MRLLAVLMIVPVAVTAFFLYQTHMSTIDFAGHELVGVEGLRTVWPNIEAGARGEADGRVTPDARIATVFVADDASSMRGQSGANLIGAADTVFQNISDRSNLTLDPDLDSFYIMDVQSTKLPSLLVEGRKIVDGQPAAKDTSAFVAALAALDESAKRTTQARIGAKLPAGEQQALDGLNAAAQVFAKEKSPANWNLVTAASSQLFAASNADLGHLLDVRIRGAWSAIVGEIGSSVAVLLAALFLTLVIASGLAGRLKILSGKMQAIARGEDAGDIPFQSDRHETGIIVKTLAAFKASLAETERMRMVQRHTEDNAVNDRRRAMLDLSEEFERSVLSIIDHVKTSTTRLMTTSESLCVDADQTTKSSSLVASSMETSAMNVQSVAGATEEMSASSHAIADQASTAASAASDAAREAQGALGVVNEMHEAATRINSAVELIAQITSQTNLLALNATIEAARAGEAGKGFSVVAAEVKALAQQTARATEEITHQVQGVQHATRHATSAMSSISAAVLRLQEISLEISHSVARQTSAVAEISSSTQEMAATSSRISVAIGDVSATAGQTEEKARASLGEILELASQADQLKDVASSFLQGIRVG